MYHSNSKSNEHICTTTDPSTKINDQEKNQKNLQKCLDLCEENGYFLSLQTHKIVGLK